MRRAALVFLLFALFLSVAVAQDDCPDSSWPKFSVLFGQPAAGTIINITQPTLFDKTVDTPIELLQIFPGGGLYFDPAFAPSAGEAALILRAKKIVVPDGAKFVVGCASNQWTQPAEIILYGKRSAYSTADISLNPGLKNIIVSGGLFQIQVQIDGPTWTKLAENAPAGSTSIKLLDAVSGWRVGDTVVVASTDFDDWQSETRTISAISGTTITLDSPLTYLHWGSVWSAPNGDSVDERGEVGLLTRRLKIHGDVSDGETLLSDGTGTWWGGHIFITKGNVQISGAELFHMGQAGFLARYPIHFHAAQDMTGSSVRKCGIHDTFQRCLVIHWTHNLQASDNVAYNATGHCYFFEDGIEYGNNLTHNLGVLTRPPRYENRLLATDDEPAMFWVTSAPNHFYDNAAVGGTFGWWYSLPEHPIGLAGNSLDPKITWPRQTVSGDFKNNVAHSCQKSGVFLDRGITENPPCAANVPKDQCGDAPDNTGYGPVVFSPISAGDTRTMQQIQDFINNQPRGWNTFEDYTAYKNREFGFWSRGSNTLVLRPKLADNRFGCQFPGDGHTVLNGVFVAETDNIGTINFPVYEQGRSRPTCSPRSSYCDPSPPVIGYREYDAGGPDLIIDCNFHNFQNFTFQFDYKVRIAAGISAQDGPNTIPTRHMYIRNRFFNSSETNRLWWSKPGGNHARGMAIYDADGSLTGDLKMLTKGGCGSFIVANQAHLLTPDCEWANGWNAWVCRGEGVSPARRMARLSFDANWSDRAQYVEPLPCCSNKYDITLTRLDSGANVTLDPDDTEDYNYQTTPPTTYVTQEFHTNIVANSHYMATFNEGSTPPHFYFQLIYSRAGNAYTYKGESENEWLRAVFQFPTGTTFNVTNQDGSQLYTSVATRDALVRNTYFVDTEGRLWIHLEQAADDFSYYREYAFYSSSVTVQVRASCPSNNCKTSSWNIPAPAGIPAPGKPFSRMCQLGGGFTRGTPTFAPNGAVTTIFADQFIDNWGLTDNVTAELLSGDSVGLASAGNMIHTTFTPYQGTSIRARSSANGVPLTGLTHIRLQVRGASGSYAFNLNVRARALNRTNLPSVAIDNPWILSTTGLPDDQKWSEVWILLSDLGLTSADTLTGVDISSRMGRPIQTYLDNIQVGSYALTYAAGPAPPTGGPAVAAPLPPSGGVFPSGALPDVNGGYVPGGTQPPGGSGGGSSTAASLSASLAMLLAAFVVSALLL